MEVNLQVLLELVTRSSLHPSLPVEIEPIVIITHWSVLEAEFGDGCKTRHIVGRHIDKGRASTAIQLFDTEKKRITTRSGRIYQLKGDHGTDKDAKYVWNQWCALINVKNFVDVTHEYL